MYVPIVVLLMLVFPVTSILAEKVLFESSAGIIALIGRWFVFWAVGVRLFLAGLRQTLTPEFTAEQIFEIKTKEPLVIVQELGFANLSMGTLGVITIFQSSWITPAAIVGGLFYGLAGVRHLLKKERNLLENVAMASDLFAFAVLLAYVVAAISG